MSIQLQLAAALRQRGSLTVWFTEEAIGAWKAEPRITWGGQPRYSGLTIATALTLRAVFRLALPPDRRADRLHHRPAWPRSGRAGPYDLSRRAETLHVPRSRLRRNAEPMHLLVDSTGLKLCGAGEWLLEKHGTKTRRAWRTLHSGTDADTGEIVAATLTGSDACDASQVGPLLDQVACPVPRGCRGGAATIQRCAERNG